MKLTHNLRKLLTVTVSWFAVLSAFGAIGASAALGSVLLSFEGTVDIPDGFTVGGIAAPVGSPFTLEVGIDDGMAVTGRYPVESISYTLVVGSYTTVTDWTNVVELVATPAGPSIHLESDPFFANPDEHFVLTLDGFGSSTIDDPFSWGGPSPLFGDIIVRGLGGFDSPDQLSGAEPYSGTMVLTVVPEPASIGLLLFLIGGVGCARRRRAS